MYRELILERHQGSQVFSGCYSHVYVGLERETGKARAAGSKSDWEGEAPTLNLRLGSGTCSKKEAACLT